MSAVDADVPSNKNDTTRDSRHNLSTKRRMLKRKLDASARRLAPKVKESVDETKQYAKAHDEEIKSGAKEGAKVLSELATPPILRPAVKAFLAELEEETKDPGTETK